ncbi:hypothetical protein WR25_14841 [Diploscapter pachys]|uniref:Uncharacterized protein n=1 Tax=Diploscapter pachys TaxID=2018661 RepID=A0A2A2KN90_9BILA|nr:hypothetical protein WR25_14841 [Diploscapter pachys]
MDQPCSLKFLTERSIAIHLFKVHIRWRKLTDVAYALRDVLEQLSLAPKLVNNLRDQVAEVLREMKRWDEKHSEMFIDPGKLCAKRRAMSRNEHLRTFYKHVIWKVNRIEINDFTTALYLMETECKNWRQMQFQFACLYAMENWVKDDWKFDKKQLSDHPVYDFWLTLLESRPDRLFDTDRRSPNQKLTQCFAFAITHGYQQLVEYIWNRIGNAHRESVGLLRWRSLCFRNRDRGTMQFLCHKLCAINPIGMSRITWTSFFEAFYRSIEGDESDAVVQNKFKKRFEFLLENACPILRSRLLKMENFRILSDAFRYNLVDVFAQILEHLNPDELKNAREVVDRIHKRKQSKDGEVLRRQMMRKQMTIN